MSGWGLVLFAIGALNVVAGVLMLARWWWERRIEREIERRGEELFDQIFARRAGIDLSHTVEPRFLGRRK